MLKKYLILATLAVILAACEKPAQQLPNQPASLNQPVVDVVTDQPVEDVLPANAAIAADPHGVPVVMPEPDPYAGIQSDIPEAKERLALWEKIWATEAEVSNYLSFPNDSGLTVYSDFGSSRENAMFFDRYPVFSGTRCEFNASRIPACYDNANQRVEIQHVLESVPYMLNLDIVRHKKELKCGIELCLDAESGIPIGRIQPGMVNYVANSF